MRTAIAILIASATVANAQGISTTITRSGGTTFIETRRTGDWGYVQPGPSIQYVPKPTDADDARSREREAAWRKRCNPTLSAPDPNTGMRKYLYAAPGCEFGD